MGFFVKIEFAVYFISSTSELTFQRGRERLHVLFRRQHFMCAHATIVKIQSKDVTTYVNGVAVKLYEYPHSIIVINFN